eukprot:9173184-Ditylum_brightwellii.AAC.1
MTYHIIASQCRLDTKNIKQTLTSNLLADPRTAVHRQTIYKKQFETNYCTYTVQEFTIDSHESNM